MSSDHGRIPLDSLLAHEGFVSALARHLVADEAEAEDLAQDVWLSILQRPARRISDPRAWLKTVLKNRWRNRKRETLARARRERLVSLPEAHDPEPATRGLELRHQILEAVRSLPEPFLTTIYLRYYEGLPIAALAERMEVPYETARSRLQRGIELLRARLDRDLGPRASWMAAVGTLCESRDAAGPLAPSAPAALFGAGSHGLGIALCAAALLVLATILLQPEERADPGRIAAPREPSGRDARTAWVGLSADAELRTVAEGEGRSDFGSSAAAEPTAAPVSSEDADSAAGDANPPPGHVRVTYRILGRVVGPEGLPAPGAQVYFYRWIPTDEEGRFEAELEFDSFRRDSDTMPPPQPMIAHRAGNFPALVPDVSTLLTGDSSVPQRIELVLGGPPLAIVGRVELADGGPASGWRVCVRNPGPGYPLGAQRVPLESIASGMLSIPQVDAQGRFRLEGLADRPYDVIACDPESLLHVVAGSVTPSATPILLRAPDPSTTRAVAGRVVSRSGTPLEGTEVFAALTMFQETLPGIRETPPGSRPMRAWGRAARTDALGRFEFSVGLQEPLHLVVLDQTRLVREVWFDTLLTADDWSQLELAVPLRCEILLESHGEEPPADFIAFLDAQGEKQHIQVPMDEIATLGGGPFWRALPLGPGPAVRNIYTTEDAVDVLFYDSDGTEIERRPIQPSPRHSIRIAW